MRIRLLSAAAAVAVLVSVLPAGATDAAPAEHATGLGSAEPAAEAPLEALRERLPDGAVTAQVGSDGQLAEGRRRRIDDAFSDPQRVRDPKALLGIQREAIAEAWDVDLPPVWADEPDDEDEHEHDEWWDAPGELAWAGSGGDLTGDGLADVLVETWEPSTGRLGLRAVRGSDGAELWRRDDAGDDAYGWPAGDLTGDGIDDLVLLTWELENFEVDEQWDDCSGEGGCHSIWSMTFTQRLAVLDGADGQARWLRSWSGSALFESRWRHSGDGVVSDGSANSWRYEVENILLPYPSGDHSGDGGRDFVLNAVSVRETGTYTRDSTLLGTTGSDEWSWGLRADTTAEVAAAATGEVAYAVSAEDAPTIALLLPIGDLTGDAMPDLLWDRTHVTDGEGSCEWVLLLEECEQSESSIDLEVEAVDGRQLSRLWSRRWDGVYGVWVEPVDDLDGDGSDDLTATVATDWEDARLDALSGTDGATVWTSDVPSAWSWAVPIGSIGGDAGTDLAVLSFDETGDLVDGWDLALDLARLDGSSGETLAHSRRSVGDGYGWAYLFVGDDVDGDDVRDLGGGWVLWDDEGDELDAGGFVESGADATERFAFSGSEERFITPFGDLDGDGLGEIADVVWEPINQSEEEWRATITTRRLAPGNEAVLWTAASDDIGFPWPAGDHDGAAGDELLTTSNELTDDGWRWTVFSRHGLTLDARWRLDG